MDNRMFHLADILSVTTGRLVSKRGVAAIYDVLNFMTGNTNFTHQLGRVSEEVKPHILAQHPELAAVDASDVNRNNWQSWIAKQESTYGREFALTRMKTEAVTHKNPIEDLCEMMGPKREENN